MKKPAAQCKSCLSVCLCLSGLSALTTPRWLDGLGLNLVGIFRKGGNALLKMCVFLRVEDIRGTALTC
jgi:hypothetical protein